MRMVLRRRASKPGQATRATGPSHFYGQLTQENLNYLAKFHMVERSFEAGHLIADRFTPLDGAYLIQSGLVAASDGLSDSVWGGVLLGVSCTFGESALTDDVPHAPVTLRALMPVVTWYLSRAEFDTAALLDWRKKKPLLVAEIESRARLNELLPDVVRALARFPPFGNVSMFRIAELAQLAEVHDLRTGETLDNIAGGVNPGDWILVAGGQLVGPGDSTFFKGSTLIFASRHEAPKRQRLNRIPNMIQGGGPGLYFACGRVKESQHGIAPRVAGAAATTTDDANDDEDLTLIVRIAAARLVGVARKSARLDRALDDILTRDPPEIVGIIDDGTATLPLGALAAFLVDSLRKLPHASMPGVGLLRIEADRPPGPSLQSDFFLGSEVKVRTVTVSNRHELAQRARELGCAYVVLDTTGASQEWFLENGLDALTKVVVIGGKLRADIQEALRDKHVVRSVLLHHEKVGDYVAYYPGTIRLSFSDVRKLATTESLKELNPRDQESIARLARAVAEMRVGVALGGGAALGYSHLALLQELVRQKVPIDVISGVSFGSLAGAFFAAGGLETLSLLVERAASLQLTKFASSVVPGLARNTIDHYLGHQRLEYLTIPFFPIGLDLNSGEEWCPAQGTVGYGVEAASELPLFFSPLVVPRKRIRVVDGAYVNNVPEGILVRERADFIISSDVIPAPLPRKTSSLSRLTSFINPISRFEDNAMAVSTLMRIANNRDSSLASYDFTPFSGASMFNFTKAAEIIERTRPQATAFAMETQRKYRDSTLLRADRARG